MDIIEKLYYGEIAPHDHKRNSDTLNEIESLEETLRGQIDHKNIKTLLAYFDAHNAYKEEIAFHNFRHGFELAYKFMFEGLK
ncbi:MAG: hypothetical protein FWG33_01255 [Oscillospiraceae bacterium]|nr:hypothetical protein [Oscillospiraceae bacterium]